METSRYWRLQQQRYRLVGEQCNKGHFVFPPRDICPSCSAVATQEFQFSGKGEIYSYTTIADREHAPEGFEFATPYAVAIIQLTEGPKVAAQLTDVDTASIQIGMPVEMVTRKLREDGPRGMIVYGYKFRPLLSNDSNHEITS